jgi:hypothetical protein
LLVLAVIGIIIVGGIVWGIGVNNELVRSE